MPHDVPAPRRSWKPRDVSSPRPGHFLVRLVRGGPRVAAMIVHEDGLWRAVINGHAFEAASDPALAPRVFSIWHGGETVPEASYHRHLAEARAASGDDPLSRPTRPIDLARMRSIF